MQPGRRTRPDLGLRSCKWNLGQILLISVGKVLILGGGTTLLHLQGGLRSLPVLSCLDSAPVRPLKAFPAAGVTQDLGLGQKCIVLVLIVLVLQSLAQEVMPRLELSQQPQLSRAEHRASGCRHRS